MPRATSSQYCLTLHEQEVASAVDPGWRLSTVINGAGRYEPVHDDQIVVAQLRDERLKNVLDAKASLEVLEAVPSVVEGGGSGGPGPDRIGQVNNPEMEPPQ